MRRDPEFTDAIRDEATVPDVRDTPWYRLAGEIQDLRASGAYVWAEATLEGIEATVRRTKRVTAGQLRAIEGIRGSEKVNRAWDQTGRYRRWR